MATVYLAEDAKHHRKVAVKVLRPDLGATACVTVSAAWPGVPRAAAVIVVCRNLSW